LLTPSCLRWICPLGVHTLSSLGYREERTLGKSPVIVSQTVNRNGVRNPRRPFPFVVSDPSE
jgi:hypothetical protein